jgi:uncharacterized protein
MKVLSHVIGFEWDAGNAQKNWQKHQVSNVEAEEVFFNQPLLVVSDEKHSDLELRYLALGKTNEGRLLHLSFTLRKDRTLIRVISARDMHRKERKMYENT